jgi:hypothetical protein
MRKYKMAGFRNASWFFITLGGYFASHCSPGIAQPIGKDLGPFRASEAERRQSGDVRKIGSRIPTWSGPREPSWGTFWRRLDFLDATSLRFLSEDKSWYKRTIILWTELNWTGSRIHVYRRPSCGFGPFWRWIIITSRFSRILTRVVPSMLG